MQLDQTEKALSKDFLKSVTPLEKVSSSPPQYLVERQSRTFLLERRGICQYERCQALCCRILCLDLEWNDYLAGFAEKGTCAPLIHQTCRYLAENSKCERWDKPQFPRACDNFPVPGDPMYLEVMDTCSFSFVFLHEILDTDPTDKQTD